MTTAKTLNASSGKLFCLAASALAASAAAAHHSYAAFDLQRPFVLEGVIIRFDWANPHVYIEIETDGPDGERWQVQAETPGSLALRGWSAESLVPGERVTINAAPARNPARRMAVGGIVVKENGARLNIRPDLEVPSNAPTGNAGGLSGHWLTEPDLAVQDAFLEPATAWALTEKGKHAVETYDDADNPSKDCVPEPLPYTMIWTLVRTIDVGADRVVIRDGLGGERTIWTDIESHDGAPATNLGHSIGRWNGDVLEIDTANFAEHRRGNAFGLPSGPQKHLVEWLALTPDRTELLYSFRLEDPEYLAEPVTGELKLAYRPDLPAVREPCDPQIARRYLESL